jgi:hypothetical protein
MGQYILIGQTPVPEPDLMKWAEWMQTADCIVFQEEIAGGVVSTVFLGLDHQYGAGPPLLFETMVFRDGESVACHRCGTWREAEAQHGDVLAAIRLEKTLKYFRLPLYTFRKPC